MGHPRKNYKDPVYGAILEMISAATSLQMEPMAIPRAKGIFLCERDKWAAHALKHINAALCILQKSYNKEKRNVLVS